MAHLTNTFAPETIKAESMTMLENKFNGTSMSQVFQVKPKRIKRSNGTVLTPEMVVTVTTQQHTHSILQWSQGGAGGIHAPLYLRLQEGVLQSE